MRLLLDEHFSPEIARQLRNRGHDVVAAREQLELHGLSDRELLAVATVEGRAVVTENVGDFVELHRRLILGHERHAGIIFTSGRQFPRSRRAIGRLVGALEALLAASPATDALVEQTWWLER